MRRVLLLAVVVVAAGCGGDGDGDGDGGAPAAAGDTVQVSALDFQFDPARIEVDAGATTFSLTNDGQAPHALTIEQDGSGKSTATISPGDSASVTVELEPGEYTLYCPVGNHRQLGMEGVLVVGG